MPNPCPSQKQSTFKENLYANLVLWGWVGLLMTISVIFRDKMPVSNNVYQERQKLFQKIRKEKAEKLQQNRHPTNAESPRLIKKRNTIVPTPSLNTK